MSWLFGEDRGETIRILLADAELIVSSELTLLECDRVLRRAVTTGQISEAQAADRRTRLTSVALHWTVLTLHAAVIERAHRSFPSEPIRTLDALHLATALVFQTAIPDLAILSLDHRVRSNGEQLGFVVVPNVSQGFSKPQEPLR